MFQKAENRRLTMTTNEPSKEDLNKQVSDLARLRDQIRVDLHLAGMDLRDEWNKLEKKLPDLDQALRPLETAARDGLDTLVTELRRFGERLREGTKPSAG